jgi:hypothetical protein
MGRFRADLHGIPPVSASREAGALQHHELIQQGCLPWLLLVHVEICYTQFYVRAYAARFDCGCFMKVILQFLTFYHL